MIVTVTPNPSVDRTLEVDRLHRGHVVRSHSVQVDPGGKGINVVRALVGNGVHAVAVVPVGGAEGRQLVDLLHERDITPRVVPIAGANRANIALVEPDGTVTKINEPGPTITTVEIEALITATATAAIGASWVVTCGSLPDGAPHDLHARIVAQAHAAGARVAVDTSGPPLLAALAARPDLVKPNLDELAEAVGAQVATLGEAVDAAHRLQALGARQVLASLGPDGAILVGDGVVLHASCHVQRPVSSVGAGDSSLAGFLTSDDPVTALRTAVAFGAAAVQLPGSSLPNPHDLHPEDVRVTDDLDRDRPLTGPRRDEERPRLGVR